MTQLNDALRAARENSDNIRIFYQIFNNARVFLPVAPNQTKLSTFTIEKEGKRYILGFDSIAKLHAWANMEIDHIEISGSELINKIGDDVHFILNMGSDPKKFWPEEIQYLKEGEGTIKESGGAGFNFNVDKFTSEIQDYLSDFSEVKSAYLIDGPIEVTLILEMEEEAEEVFLILKQNLLPVLRHIVGAETPFDIEISEKIPNFSSLTETQSPIYSV